MHSVVYLCEREYDLLGVQHTLLTRWGGGLTLESRVSEFPEHFWKKGAKYRITVEPLSEGKENAMPVTFDLTPAYPTLDEYLAATKVVVGKLKGEDIEPCCAAHAGWLVTGYGLSQTVPHVHTSSAPLDAAQVVDVLESTTRMHGVLDSVDWAAIVQFLYPLLLEWLRKK